VVSLRAGTGDAVGGNLVSKAATASRYVAAHADPIEAAGMPHSGDKKYIPQRQKEKKVIDRTDVFAGITRTTIETLGQSSDSFGLVRQAGEVRRVGRDVFGNRFLVLSKKKCTGLETMCIHALWPSTG
jgi:hypothetical protein